MSNNTIKMAKQKYCETLTPGFYLIEETFAYRCYYLTGTTKGNKWINLNVPNPKWTGLMWNAITPDDNDLTHYHQQNPTSFII
jgi:hypothetical protein